MLNKKRLTFLFLSSILSLSSAQAFEEKLKDLIGEYVSGYIDKEAFLGYVHKNNFPTDVKNVEIVSNKYGQKTIRWYFTFSNDEVMRSLASTNSSDLNFILEEYKKNKTSKADVLAYLKKIKFSYDVVDLELIKNHAQKTDIRWVIGARQDGSRAIASVATVKTTVKEPHKPDTIFSKYKLVLNAMYGQETVSNPSGNLKYNSLRFAASANIDLNDVYSIYGKFGLSQFQNLEYSQSSDSKSATATSPEITLGVVRKGNSFQSLVGYDLRSAFFVEKSLDDVYLARKQFLHRPFYEGSYFFNDQFSLAANVGYVVASSAVSLSGVDLGANATYRLGISRNYVFGLHWRQSQLSAQGGGEFKNAVTSFSFGYAF